PARAAFAAVEYQAGAVEAAHVDGGGEAGRPRSHDCHIDHAPVRLRCEAAILGRGGVKAARSAARSGVAGDRHGPGSLRGPAIQAVQQQFVVDGVLEAGDRLRRHATLDRGDAPAKAFPEARIERGMAPEAITSFEYAIDHEL